MRSNPGLLSTASVFCFHVEGRIGDIPLFISLSISCFSLLALFSFGGLDTPCRSQKDVFFFSPTPSCCVFLANPCTIDGHNVVDVHDLFFTPFVKSVTFLFMYNTPFPTKGERTDWRKSSMARKKSACSIQSLERLPPNIPMCSRCPVLLSGACHQPSVSGMIRRV